MSIFGGVMQFVPRVMLMDRGDAAGVLGLLEILVSKSEFCYTVVCVS
jgi:hypothetical protein